MSAVRPEERVGSVVEVEEAVGKGSAVLEGFRRARGAAVAFAHADGATSPESLIMLFGALERSDIAIGSSRLKSSTITLPQTPSRRLLGFVFARTARLLFGMPFMDTQCGAKALRAEAAHRYSRHEWPVLDVRRVGAVDSE